MVKYKYIVPRPVMWYFVYISMPDTNHKYKKIGPKVTELIYEIPSPYLTKKRGNNDHWKYQQQKGQKDKKGVNCKKD